MAQTGIPSILIAPCGMNCGLCMAHLREKKRCAGCNIESPEKMNHCRVCSIKFCPLRNAGSKFCFDCQKYPCVRLRNMDKRYRTKYSVSLIGNLNEIKASGLDAFMKSENTRWVCPKCGHPVCVNNGRCYHCNQEKGPSE
jgi:Protein of unknown function (DUF3795)